jgi:hypothetical protein
MRCAIDHARKAWLDIKHVGVVVLIAFTQLNGEGVDVYD